MPEKAESKELVSNNTPEAGENDENAPQDKCKCIYFIFFFIGVGTLLPWSFYITATQYFQYQLRNRSLPADVDPLLPKHRTELQKLFSNYLTISSLIPATLANFANLMVKDCLPVFFRLISASATMLFMFIITTALAKVEVETNIFFVVTLVTVVINNVGSSFTQSSTYGIFSILPDSNARAFLEGQAVAGIIAAIANLITIALVSGPLDVGFAYFLIGVCIIAITIGLFITLFQTPYFKYYWKGAKLQASAAEAEAEEESLGMKVRKTLRSLWLAMWEVRWAGSALFLTLAITLTVFPSIYVLLVPNQFDQTNVFHTKYYHAVVVFLNYNIFDYIGRISVGWFKWPKFEQKKLLLGMAILRAVFIPISMFCNINSKRIPTAFYHDAIPGILICLLGLSNGYLLSLGVNYAPRYASKGNEEGCGIATSTYLSLGLCFGVTLSYGLVALV